MHRRFLVVFIALCFFVSLSFLYGKYSYHATGPLKVVKNIVIVKGSISEVLKQLQKEQVVSQTYWSGFVFCVAVKLTHNAGALHAAELAFPEQVSIQKTIDILRHAKPVQHKLTIPEGLTAYQIAEAINEAPVLTGYVDPPQEGTVLPQTYVYTRGMSREMILHRMQIAMQKKLQEIWENREVIPEVKTQQDLVTLASIVEKETALQRERPMVARVFINRLHSGMRLQSDPTVIYALTDGKGGLNRPLTRQDWEIANFYNTYWADALPPTPICSPGVASMEAVAHPVEGNILYFVANGTGGHSFSSSLAAHNHNVTIYRKK